MIRQFLALAQLFFRKMKMRPRIGAFKSVKKGDADLALLFSVILYWHYWYGEGFKYAID